MNTRAQNVLERKHLGVMIKKNIKYRSDVTEHELNIGI